MVLKIIWLAASGYLFFNFFKLLPPFSRRRWVLFWLIIVQCAAFVAAVSLQATPQEDGSATASPPVAQAPAKAPHDPEPDIDKLIVHTDPNAPQKPPSAAARKDAREAKEEARALMPNVDAAFLILKHGIETGNRQEIQTVHQAMEDLQIKLLNRKPGAGAELWPERDDDGYEDCMTAAERLGDYADSALNPLTVEEVKARLQMQDQFRKAYAHCKAWLGHW